MKMFQATQHRHLLPRQDADLARALDNQIPPIVQRGNKAEPPSPIQTLWHTILAKAPPHKLELVRIQ